MEHTDTFWKHFDWSNKPHLGATFRGWCGARGATRSGQAPEPQGPCPRSPSDIPGWSSKCPAATSSSVPKHRATPRTGSRFPQKGAEPRFSGDACHFHISGCTSGPGMAFVGGLPPGVPSWGGEAATTSHSGLPVTPLAGWRRWPWCPLCSTHKAVCGRG